MTTVSLPENLPQWYKVDGDKGWSPQTSDIRKTKEVNNAWNKTIPPTPTSKPTIELKNLHVLSPLQIGGGALPEGHNLPAQISGIPCIPGSSLRGSFLSWIVKLCQEYESDAENASLSQEEYDFWQRHLYKNKDKDKNLGWKPKAIRFEHVWLKELEAFPLNAQQDWQIFGKETESRYQKTEEDKLKESRKLGVLWQVDSYFPDSPRKKTISPIKIDLALPIQDCEKIWVEDRLRNMLMQQGIGKGVASGLGRLGDKDEIPEGKWQIKLEGQKPAIISGGKREQDYRWTPQVLRACLRGYFTRIALIFLDLKKAKKLTSIIFGSLKRPGKLVLTSYLANRDKSQVSNYGSYSNTCKSIVEEIWTINIDCNDEYESLISRLLFIAFKLGGLGAGWRKPPHLMRRGAYRGSKFNFQTARNDDLVTTLNDLILWMKQLAETHKLKTLSSPSGRRGSLISIWHESKIKEGKIQEKPYQLIHEVCATNAKNRPNWCGGQDEPSMYSISDRGNLNLVTIFDPKIDKMLRKQKMPCLDFKLWGKVWSYS